MRTLILAKQRLTAERISRRPAFHRVGMILMICLAFSASGAILDDCLNGRGAPAIAACRAALAEGVKKRSVFEALGRHLQQAGRLEEAIVVYRQGLVAYPGDNELTSQLKLAQSNLDEQRWIKQRENRIATEPSAQAKATFKINAIRCKTLEGAQALKACGKALSVEPQNAELKRRFAALRGPTTSTPVTGTERSPAGRTADLQPNLDRERQHALVSNIQRQLAELGYEPGPPDGLAGGRTRDSARAYAEARSLPPASQALGQALSDSLDDAVSQQSLALGLLREAAREIDLDRPDAAGAKIDQGNRLAPWSRRVEEERKLLEARLANAEEDKRNALAQAERARIEQLIAQIANQANEMKASGDPVAALQIVDNGLDQFPQASVLEKLRGELTAEQAEQQRQRELLERQEGAAAKLAMAREAVAKDDLDAASAIVRGGLAIIPDHAELLTLNDQIAIEQERRRVAAAKAEAQVTRERALEKAQRQQELAQEQERRQREHEQDEALTARVNQLSLEADRAADAGDFRGAFNLIEQAQQLAPDDQNLAALHGTVKARELTAGAEQRYRRAQELAKIAVFSDERIDVLDEAMDMTTAALALQPESETLWRLRSDIANDRTTALSAAKAQKYRAQRLSTAKSVVRERTRHLAKVETDIATMELALKLDAQRALKRLWSNPP